jgi:hypothetical protein
VGEEFITLGNDPDLGQFDGGAAALVKLAVMLPAARQHWQRLSQRTPRTPDFELR